jgi:uncharacterized membrane protein YhhN
MNKLSFVGVILSFTGNVFVTLNTTSYQVYGFEIFLVSNIILGYVNRKDFNQVGLYIGFQVLAIYGILVRT